MLQKSDKVSCPHCSNPAGKVFIETMCHHLLFPHNTDIPTGQPYYYCSEQNCEIAYFSSERQYLIKQLQTAPQIQNHTICFCFGITRQGFTEQVHDTGEKTFFTKLDDLAYTKKCLCKQKNPSGKGCLKTFKKIAESAEL